jgi:SAM-dependent methyltransferase
LTARSQNLDPATVRGFGEEWAAYDQTALGEAEYSALFDGYFAIFPFDELPPAAEGFDLGCGSGRWAAGVLPRVGTLHCIDPSEQALAVARRRLAGQPGARFHAASVDAIPLADASQDFGYSLGVLHHVPDTVAALRDCTRKLKPGAPFLLYLYYRFDNRPGWYALIWQASDLIRRLLSRAPFPLRNTVSSLLAALIYWPLARLARLAGRLGGDVRNWPLSSYQSSSFYSMRTDALDRFGTRLEQRFTRAEIENMMRLAGLAEVRFSETAPFWVACGFKQA